MAVVFDALCERKPCFAVFLFWVYKTYWFYQYYFKEKKKNLECIVSEDNILFVLTGKYSDFPVTPFSLKKKFQKPHIWIEKF